MINKKRVGIVTITNDGYNFGNRLQNYALQTVLEQLGFDVETLNRPIRCNQRKWWKCKKMVAHYFIPFRQTIEHRKAGNFFFWNKKHIHWSKIEATDNNMSIIAEQYDYFIAGSDQIWNPKFPWGSDPYMFLQFARPGKRIAYAPSFGLDKELLEPYFSQFKKIWKNWMALSCREKAGARIMSDLTGNDVPCLLDPTLLLNANDWQKMTCWCHTPKKYILLYILGELTGEYRRYLDELKEHTGCKVIDVMNDIQYAGCDPSKFVALIQHSDWVVADSYHAFVFATIFHRPFTFIDRVGWGMNMNSRMETLAEKLHIGISDWKAITEIVPIDWNQVDKAITAEQQIARDYLTIALQ